MSLRAYDTRVDGLPIFRIVREYPRTKIRAELSSNGSESGVRGSLRTKSELSSHQMARMLRVADSLRTKTSALSSHQMLSRAHPVGAIDSSECQSTESFRDHEELRFTIQAGWTSPSLAVKVREDFSLRDGDSLLDVFVVLLSLEPSSYRRIFWSWSYWTCCRGRIERYGRIYVM